MCADYIVLGSDSGRIVILEYIPQRNAFERVHQETFGKTGCRRIVPGQYMAVDPKGRAVMISAVEKQKFVYVLNRDAAARLTISSPLEAHKAHTLVYHIVGVDVGYENPLFACLEMDYEVGLLWRMVLCMYQCVCVCVCEGGRKCWLYYCLLVATLGADCNCVYRFSFTSSLVTALCNVCI